MIQINLLPLRSRKGKVNDRQFLLAYAVCIVLTLATITYMGISQAHRIDASSRHLGSLRRQVAKYRKYGRMLKKLKSEVALIQKKTVVIKNLEKDRDRIVRALALLSAEVPADKMWFEKLRQRGGTMSLNGIALSNGAIAEFMRNLESSPYVAKGSVNLQHSRQISVRHKKLREFRVTYRFRSFSALPKAPTKIPTHKQS